MIILYTATILFFSALTLNLPMLRKPLSEDDGNWYYLSVFWKKDVRMFKGYDNNGYFGIPWISARLYNLIGLESLTFFYYFKVVWYSLNALSIYWLSFCFWNDPLLSFIAGLSFAIVTAVPNTLFVLTYAEHFFILPINLCIIFTYYGMTTGCGWYFLLSGIMSAWSVQIKTPALLFSILLPVAFYFSPDPLVNLSYYSLAFVGINLLPIYLIKRHNGNSRQYLTRTFYPVIEALNLFLIKLKLKPLFNRIWKISNHISTGSYVQSHHDKDIKVQWASFKSFILPSIKNLYLLLILATAQIFFLFIKFDYFTLSIILLFIVFLLMQQAQKNYYTPHFNPCWAPASILAAKSICDFWPYLINFGFYRWAVIAFLGYELIKIVKIIIKSFFKREKDSFGYLDPLFGKVYRLSESVGEYIKKNSNEAEKLFVWGDQPSIYLYARREAFNPHITYLVPYAHENKILIEEELLCSLREKPPELLIFYNCKVIDGWNIKRLQESIGIPYDHMKSFQITDDRHKKPDNPQGICFNFPLYRRNDKIYREILIDRANNAEINNDLNQARKHFNKVLEISPECFEASLRLTLLNDENSGKMQRSYIGSRIENAKDPVCNSILLRLLSEIDAEEGNFDSAMNYLEMALVLNPNDFRIYNGLGKLHFSMGKIEDAAKSFNRAVGLNAYSADAYNNIGVILSQKGKQADAVKCFQKALSIMPDHQHAHKNREDLRTG